jgi:hypothetical protein
LSIYAWESAAGKETNKTIELTKLPDWPGMSSTSAAIQLPQNHGDAVKITLNISPQLWNNLSQPAQQHLPAIVERDPASIIAFTEEKHREEEQAPSISNPSRKLLPPSHRERDNPEDGPAEPE